MTAEALKGAAGGIWAEERAGEPRGEGPALCHSGLASSLPRRAGGCPSAAPQQVPEPSLFHQESKHTYMFTEKIGKAPLFSFSSIKGAEFFLSLRIDDFKCNNDSK